MNIHMHHLTQLEYELDTLFC